MSLDCDTAEGNGSSVNPDIFRGGRGVVYESRATNLWNVDQDRALFTAFLDGSAIPDVYESRLKPQFVRGDVDPNGAIDITDAIVILNALFLSGSKPECVDAADANDDGFVDVSDSVRLFNFMFTAGEPPQPPFPGCGFDPTDDLLSCRRRGMTGAVLCPDDHSHD